MRSTLRPQLLRPTLLLGTAILLGACAETAPTGLAPAAPVSALAAAAPAAPLLHWAPAINAPAGGDFAAAPDGRLFAAAEMYGLLVADGGAMRWQRVASFPTDVSPFAVAVSPDGAIHVGTDRGVLHSNDGGATWHAGGLTEGYVRQLATDANGALYAGVMGMGGGVLRSDDGGTRWTMVFGPFEGRGGIIDWLSVRKGDVLLGLYSQTPAWSRDRGETWEYIGALWELPEWNAFANHMIETSSGSLLATWAGGIARSSSEEQGTSFKHVYAGAQAHKLAQDAATGAIYAMRDDGSVLRSTDDGVTWAPYAAGFRPRGVVAFAAAPAGGLVLGTWEGIWRTVP